MPSALRTSAILAADIKVAHSVFALPFAVLAAFMAAAPDGGPPDPREFTGQLGLVVLAMVAARTTAMLANRLLDREIDRRNPRTSGRALPSGQVTVGAAVTALALAATSFMVVCVGFGLVYGNWWPAMLGGPVLGWICAYPLLKRFTVTCHLYLGSALAISPLAAALAVHPPALLHQPALWLLAAMVLCWVAGFDIIYALQDLEVDRRQGLGSIPGRYGPAKALWCSRVLHLLAFTCLAAALMLDRRLAVLFGAAVFVVGGLLLYEHLTVRRWGTGRMALAFFTINGLVSCVLGIAGVVDVMI